MDRILTEVRISSPPMPHTRNGGGVEPRVRSEVDLRV